MACQTRSDIENIAQKTLLCRPDLWDYLGCTGRVLTRRLRHPEKQSESVSADRAPVLECPCSAWPEVGFPQCDDTYCSYESGRADQCADAAWAAILVPAPNRPGVVDSPRGQAIPVGYSNRREAWNGFNSLGGSWRGAFW